MTDPNRSSRLVTFLGAGAIVAALYLARDVLIPLVLASLLSFLLSPLVTRIERWVGRIAAVITVVLLGAVLLGGVTYLVGGQLTEVARMLPEYRENITKKLSSLRGGTIEKATAAVKQIQEDMQAPPEPEQGQEPAAAGASEVDDPVPALRGAASRDPLADPTEVDPLEVQVVENEPTVVELFAGMFAPMLGPIGTGGMVVVLILFMLLARDDLRDRFVRLMGRTHIRVTTQAMDEAGRRVSRYLAMQMLSNLINGVAIATGLFFLGVPNFLLWGLLAVVLRFIPYVGPILSAAGPLLITFALSEDWTWLLTVAAMYVVVELLSSNLLDPWLFGTGAGVSPLAVILTAVVWTWLWGPIGLLLATPLTACMVVLGKHVPQLRFIDILLGDDPGVEPHARFCDRMVELDEEEAVDLAEKSLQERGSLLAVYDELLIPALELLERDRRTGDLDERRATFVHGMMRDLIEDLGETERRRIAAAERAAPGAATAGIALPSDLRVLAVTRREEADGLVALMLAQVVRSSGAPCETVLAADLAGMRGTSDVLCLSVVPASGASPARQLYRQARAALPKNDVVIGLWGATGSLEKARARIGCDETTPIVTTLRDALAAIANVAQPEAQLARG
jgi:predicted PurR-regulated permease PerM